MDKRHEETFHQGGYRDRYTISVWKNVQNHKPLGKWTLKAQWYITTYLSKCLKLKYNKHMEKMDHSDMADGNIE